MKKTVFIATAFVLLNSVIAQGTVPSHSNDTKGSEAQDETQLEQQEQRKTNPETPKEKKDNKDDIDEIVKIQQALHYGLESEILEVTGKIQKQDFETLQNDFIKLFTDTKSPAVREALFALYQKYENQQLVSVGIELLEQYAEQKRTFIKSILTYLTVLKPEHTPNLSSILQRLITEEATEYGVEAAAVLGEIGGLDEAAFLIEYFESMSIEDSKQELVLKQAIATALEKLHTENTRDFFIERARDENENAYIRASAASGLAQMGNIDVVPLLIEFFEEPEPLLRTAAIKGAAAFDTEDTQKLVLQGFKDSYYKVRLEALQTAQKTKRQEIVPYVLYRAQHDPVEAVRFSAVETLAILNAPEGNKWLSETFRDSKKSEKLRVKILNAALTHNLTVIAGDLNTVVLPTITDDKQKKLRYELGKELAKIENQASAEICMAFLQSKDTLTKSIGLDMFQTNKYQDARPLVEEIAQDETQGTLHRRAKRLLEKGINKEAAGQNTK